MTEPAPGPALITDAAVQAPTSAPGVEISGLSKSYGETRVLDRVDLQVPQREFHALLGPSGSGKTTILRIIAGFTGADAGVVRVSGRDMTNIPAEQRDIGVVFQNYALFPHMSVFGNVEFGLRMRGIDTAERRERVAETLSLVRMSGYERRRPVQLSGGQQQRIALARALVIKPKVLLLDEPLSALDRKIRGEVREELRRIQHETGVTAIIVTHDQEEALSLSHRMLVLESGRVRQAGTPDEVYRRPADAFVADFVGSFNSLPVTLADDSDGLTARIGKQSLRIPSSVAVPPSGAGPARLLVRPEELTIRSAGTGDPPPSALHGRIDDIDFAGPVVTLNVGVEGHSLRVLALSPGVLAETSLEPGARAWVGFTLDAVQLAPAADTDWG